MGIREDVLALADELDGASIKDDCDACLASGTELCRGDLECAESAHKACAKRLREIVERDEREATTMSAYDLLPDEDRKAIAWVREHGGLDAVKDAVKTNEWALSLAVIAHDALYGEKSERDTTPTEFKRELDKRLMPEGMEWPRFDDDAPIKFGDEFADGLGNTRKCQSVELLGGDGGVCDAAIRWGEHDCDFMLVCVWQGERVKRPAALAADGEPLEVGQTVYATHYGHVKCTVLAIECVVDGYLVEVENESGHKFRQTPDEFTHQRPVLDEDGVPIKVGDTVFRTSDGREFEVTGIYGAFEVRVRDESMDVGVWTTPCGFTHERPDSWERIEEDARLQPTEYTDRYRVGRIGFESEDMRVDLVRRARKLAERGEL